MSLYIKACHMIYSGIKSFMLNMWMSSHDSDLFQQCFCSLVFSVMKKPDINVFKASSLSMTLYQRKKHQHFKSTIWTGKVVDWNHSLHISATLCTVKYSVRS